MPCCIIDNSTVVDGNLHGNLVQGNLHGNLENGNLVTWGSADTGKVQKAASEAIKGPKGKPKSLQGRTTRAKVSGEGSTESDQVEQPSTKPAKKTKSELYQGRLRRARASNQRKAESPESPKSTGLNEKSGAESEEETLEEGSLAEDAEGSTGSLVDGSEAEGLEAVSEAETLEEGSEAGTLGEVSAEESTRSLGEVSEEGSAEGSQEGILGNLTKVGEAFKKCFEPFQKCMKHPSTQKVMRCAAAAGKAKGAVAGAASVAALF